MKYLKKDERLDDLGFNNLKLIQNKKYFCFGTDSVLLANFAKSSNENNLVLELCAGSGVISLIFANKNKQKSIISVEIQEEMYDILERNIRLNKQNNIVPIKEDIKNIKKIREIIIGKFSKDSVDIIICNPPYKKLGTGLHIEESVKNNAKCENLCTLEDVFKSSNKLLKTKGKLYLVHKPERLVDMMDIARKHNLEAKKLQFVYPNINARASIVLVEYIKNGGNELKILEPLIEYNDDNTYTEQMKNIYNNMG